MEFRQIARADRVDFPQRHPCCYVHQADIAMLNGRRDEALALITLAYLAYDRILTGCGEVTDTVMQEKSS